MLLRRIGARLPRAPSTETNIRSTSFLSPQALPKPLNFHRHATHQYELPTAEARLDLSRPYSNYAPRGPPPYYDVYTPKSRSSRLKDMAIGSALTIIVFATYIYYQSRVLAKQLREEMDREKKLQVVEEHYEELLGEIQAGDENSPEAVERKRLLFKERAIALVRANIPEAQAITELGPLPMLPADIAYQARIEQQTIEEDDTIILLTQAPPAAEAYTGARYDITVAINAFAAKFDANAIERGYISQREPRIQEIICRLNYKLKNLQEEGTIDDVAVGVVHMWDGSFNFICHDGKVMFELRD